MSGADEASDEFDEIARLFRPLTGGARRAPSTCWTTRRSSRSGRARPGGHQGRHRRGRAFPVRRAAGLVGRKLLRVNLSDLAAKAAEPFGCFLAVAWPRSFDGRRARGVRRGPGGGPEDATASACWAATRSPPPGPLTASLTAWAGRRRARMVRRAGARPGDRLLVSGTIGDGYLALAAARGEIDDSGRLRWLAATGCRSPRLDLRDDPAGPGHRRRRTSPTAWSPTPATSARPAAWACRSTSTQLPLSGRGRGAGWSGQPDRADALVRLATGGDDYEVVCTFRSGARCRPASPWSARYRRARASRSASTAGRLDAGEGGWRHL